MNSSWSSSMGRRCLMRRCSFTMGIIRILASICLSRDRRQILYLHRNKLLCTRQKAHLYNRFKYSRRLRRSNSAERLFCTKTLSSLLSPIQLNWTQTLSSPLGTILKRMLDFSRITRSVLLSENISMWMRLKDGTWPEKHRKADKIFLDWTLTQW